MTDRWTLLFATARGDVTVDSFDASISQMDRYLGGRTGTLQATIPVPNADVGRRVEPVRWGEGHLAMYALRGLDLWWGGLLGQCTPAGSGRSGGQLQVTGSSFESYPDRREVRADWVRTAVEQLELARQIWQALAARPEGDLGIDVPAVVASGQLRDFSVLRSDARTWGSVLSEISGRDNGFEWVIDVAADGDGNRTRALTLGYPQIGRPGQAEYVLSMPGQILSYTWPGDSTRGGTSFQARGDAPPAAASDVTTQQQPLMSTVYEADDLLAAGWPLYDLTVDRPGVSDVATLNGWAARTRDTLAGSIRLPTIKARIDTLSPAILGADVKVRITDELHPAGPDSSPGIDDTFRAIGWSIRPWERGSDDEVDVIFEDPTGAAA